ncbi:MAG: ATP-binding protein, partial [Chloroflexi bacterium]|nr:ATP-binding protein [Chloroflexota bacterium]
FEPAAGLPPIWGARNHLAQVITNLLANAVNYTPEGSILVRTLANADTAEAGFEVADTGIGIEPEDLPHLFDRFYRGRRTGQSDIPGTGLGLAIAKEIVDLHLGRIEIEKRDSQGTIFRVWLPMQSKIAPGKAP